MASPPYRSPAASPPNPASASLPGSRKRTLPPVAPVYSKKRKQSSFSTTASGTLSAHPLRQVSSPPEDPFPALGARSPSVASDLTGATGARSATGASGKKRGGGRRRNDDSASVRIGDGGTRASATGRGSRAGRELSAEEPDEGEAEGEAEEDVEAALGENFEEDPSGKLDETAEKEKER